MIKTPFFIVQCETREESNTVNSFYRGITGKLSYYPYILVFEDTEGLIKTSVNHSPRGFNLTKNDIEIIPFSVWQIAKSPETKIEGWKLKDKAHEAHALFIARGCEVVGDTWIDDINKGKFHIYHESKFRENLEKAGVLRLWFHPVYGTLPTPEKSYTFSFGELTKEDIKQLKQLLKD